MGSGSGSAPSRIRTCGLSLRRGSLYPAELSGLGEGLSLRSRGRAGLPKVGEVETELEERILVEALGELGGRGRRGAKAAARLLRANRGQLELESASAPEAVLGAARQLLAGEGRLLEDEEIPAEPPQVWGLVGGGASGLNPALVRVVVRAREGGGAAVEIRGVAKEGLIRQRAGQKTAAWAREQLLVALGEAPGQAS